MFGIIFPVLTRGYHFVNTNFASRERGDALSLTGRSRYPLRDVARWVCAEHSKLSQPQFPGTSRARFLLAIERSAKPARDVGVTLHNTVPNSSSTLFYLPLMSWGFSQLSGIANLFFFFLILSLFVFVADLLGAQLSAI